MSLPAIGSAMSIATTLSATAWWPARVGDHASIDEEIEGYAVATIDRTLCARLKTCSFSNAGCPAYRSIVRKY
jgi:hypothetical protein